MKIDNWLLIIVGIIGHQKIQSFFNRSLEKGKLGQAYLFVGPESVGKFTLALDLAKKITGEVEKISSDLIILAPEVEEKKGITKKKDIKIESIRELARNLSMTSAEGHYKVAIIDEADKLNKSAQNSLLKTLEEPPAGAVIILITSNPGRLLSTISSRCQVIKFGLVSDEEIKSIIPFPYSDKEQLIFWSEGRPGLTKRMIDNKNELENKLKIKEELIELFNADISERLSWAENDSKDIEKLVDKFNIWMIVLREVVLGRSNLISQKKAFSVLNKLKKSIEILETTNANPRLTLENLLIDF